MYIQSNLNCPYLKGGPSGAKCGVVNCLINDMEDVNIKICMSQRHEACTVYFCSLHTINSGNAFEPVPCAGI
jgi:hypothetical protein